MADKVTDYREATPPSRNLRCRHSSASGIFLLFLIFLPLRAAITVDTIGSTGVDNQTYGPIWSRLVHLPGTGVYAVWVKTGMFANFYSFASNSWQGEVEVFGSQRNALGALAVPLNPALPYYRSTFVSSFINRTPRWPIIARESIPGSGVFTILPLDSALIGCQRAPIAFTNNGWLHLICTDSATQDTILYSRSTSYGVNWSSPIALSGNFPPQTPSYNIAGSPHSRRLAVVWSHPESTALWINISNDGGDSWSGPQNIFPLPSSITGARPGKFGACAIFDRNDRLNIITQVWNGTSQHPAEIWHWQENRNPGWTLVYRFAPGSALAPAEPGEPFLLRPTIGENPATGELFAVWLNYDSLNYEPQTQIARADVFIARSLDNGSNWSRPFRLTGPDSYSRLAPALAPTVTDTLYIITVVDQIAGIYEQGHGPQTVNPVVVLTVPVADLPGVTEEKGTRTILPPAATIYANHLPGTENNVRSPSPATLYSVTGEPVRTRTPSAGVYFLVSGTQRLTRKVILLR